MGLFKKKEPDMKCWNCKKLISHKKVKWKPRTFTAESLAFGDNAEKKLKDLQKLSGAMGDKIDKKRMASPNEIFGLLEYEYRGQCPECKSELTLFWKGKDSFMKVQGLTVAPKTKPFSCFECEELIERGNQVVYSVRTISSGEIQEYLVILCPKCQEENTYPFEYDLEKGIIE